MAHLRLWTPLASFLLALTWLLPNASPPWVAFHKDAWASFVLLLVGVGVIFRKTSDRSLFSIDIFSGLLVFLAAITLAQWLFGAIYFFGHAAVGVSYFLAASLSVVIGRAWEESEAGAPGDFLFLAFLVAAMGTSGLMLAQWLGIESRVVPINEMASAGRPFGNLVQPNNAATLLLLGNVSLFWYWTRRKLGRVIGILSAVYLLFFVGLTGSRIGAISAISLILIALALSYRQTAFRPARAVLSVSVIVLLLVLLVAFSWLWIVDASEINFKLPDRPSTDIRLRVYRAYLAATLENPWWGSGFGQGVRAQLSAADLGYDLSGLFTWTHNAFLDVATWFGVPSGLALAASVLAVYVRVLRTPFSMERSAYFAGVYVVFMHAMVELPHGYAYFLFPTCMLVGCILPGISISSFGIPKKLVGLGIVLLGALLIIIGRDYLRAESSFYTWRFKYANVGTLHPIEIPNAWILNQFPALLTGLRGSAKTLDDQAVEDFEEGVMLFPSPATLQHLAEVQLLRGEVAAAQRTATRARFLTSPYERRAMAARWLNLGKEDPIFQKVEWRE